MWYLGLNMYSDCLESSIPLVGSWLRNISLIGNNVNTINLPTVSRLPSYAVSRNSPIRRNVEVFIQRSVESGNLNHIMQQISSFHRQETIQLEESAYKTPEIICALRILKFFLMAFAIQLMSFIGELLCYRWQMRR